VAAKPSIQRRVARWAEFRASIVTSDAIGKRAHQSEGDKRHTESDSLECHGPSKSPKTA
jgi:hypothetical protein